ncbi:MAG TPA: ABC transporter permease [Streptosporangiaceae bacterium]|nr:ABC transporter permease [Streptosporangiaceae bacterium]
MSQVTAAVSIPAPIARPARPPALSAATAQVAQRALRKYLRTPGLFVMGMVQSALFLFMFRYVFGGAIRAGSAGYAGYLIPGYVATIVLFTGGGIAVAVAEDKAQGLTDRLLSLPISRGALVAGRTLADFTTNGWSVIFTAALGFAFGFRLPATAADGLAALGLCLLYGLVFTVVFIVIGLFAPNAQAAQGISMIAFVLAFISSTYVPPSSMPGWLQPFARYQPVTPMVNAVRSALTGGSHDLAAALIWSAALIVAFTPVAVIRYRRA